MFTFQICGYSGTGKTTLIKKLIHYFAETGTKVASIKSISSKDFRIDQPGKNTYIHAQAGANPVVAQGKNETDFLYSQPMDFIEIANKISADWLMVEGFNDFSLPKIICARDEKDVTPFLDQRTFAVAGKIAETKQTVHGLPVFNPLDQGEVKALARMVRTKVFPLLPYVDDDCCRLCGLTCSKMVDAIIQGEKSYSDCQIKNKKIQLKVGGKEIPIVPFVQNILRNNVLAVVSELTGWEKGKKIEILIDQTSLK